MPLEGEWTVVGSTDGRPSGAAYVDTPMYWVTIESMGLVLDSAGGAVIVANSVLPLSTSFGTAGR